MFVREWIAQLPPEYAKYSPYLLISRLNRYLGIQDPQDKKTNCRHKNASKIPKGLDWLGHNG
jgi:hypothetical protein